MPSRPSRSVRDRGPAVEPAVFSQYGSSAWEFVAETRAVYAWRRFVFTFTQVRKLQRLYAHIGHHLQTISSVVRDRVREAYPQIQQ